MTKEQQEAERKKHEARVRIIDAALEWRAAMASPAILANQPPPVPKDARLRKLAEACDLLLIAVGQSAQANVAASNTATAWERLDSPALNDNDG